MYVRSNVKNVNKSLDNSPLYGGLHLFITSFVSANFYLFYFILSLFYNSPDFYITSQLLSNKNDGNDNDKAIAEKFEELAKVGMYNYYYYYYYYAMVKI